MKTTYQRQDSLSAQMDTVLALATAAGCYDAADWLKSRWKHPSERTSRAVDAPQATAEVLPSRCSVQGRTGQCTKMRGHGQRHRYESESNRYIAPHVAPPRLWGKIDKIGIKSGSKTFTLSVGGPCKVQGERGLWKVIAIEQHEDGRTNVEVTNDRTGHSRVFPVAKIIYKRPAKKA